MFNHLLKKNIKTALAFTLHYSGIGRRMLLARTAGKCTVLMYHRVMTREMLKKSPSNDAIQVSTQSFERQLKFLASTFKPIELQELTDHLYSGHPLIGNRVMITFDDGWKDNHDYALELLQKYCFPAVIFVSTGFIDSNKRFWQERLTALLAEAPVADEADRQKLRGILSAHGPEFLDEDNPKRRREKLAAMIQRIKKMQYDRIETIIKGIESWAARCNLQLSTNLTEERDFLNWEELARMQDRSVEIGSHGVYHRILTKEGVDIESELRQSKETIEAHLGAPAFSLSYPNGNCDSNIIEKAVAAGYKLGFGTRFGYNDHTASPLDLRRININMAVSDTVPLFVGRLLGLW